MSASYPEAAALFKPMPRAILFDAGFTLTFHDGARLAAYAAQADVSADAAALERAERALREEYRETQGVVMRTHHDGGFSWHERLYRRLLALAETPGASDALDRAASVMLREHRLAPHRPGRARVPGAAAGGGLQAGGRLQQRGNDRTDAARDRPPPAV